MRRDRSRVSGRTVSIFVLVALAAVVGTARQAGAPPRLSDDRLSPQGRPGATADETSLQVGVLLIGPVPGLTLGWQRQAQGHGEEEVPS